MITIREAVRTDWEAIKAIYTLGIQTGNATFETVENIPTKEIWFSTKIKGSIFVAVDNIECLGWINLTSVSTRCVYAGVAEVSVYIHPDNKGKGIALMLLKHIIDFADKNGIWTIEANMFSSNKASERLHEKAGFKRLGIRESLGRLNGQWHNILMMEHRSKKIY